MDKDLKISDLIHSMDKNSFKKVVPLIGIFISPDITMNEIYRYIEKNGYSWDLIVKHYLHIIASLYRLNSEGFFTDIINWVHLSKDKEFITNALNTIRYVPENNHIITQQLGIINQVICDSPYIDVVYEGVRLLHKISKRYPQLLTIYNIHIRITYKLYEQFMTQIEQQQYFESGFMRFRRLNRETLQDKDFPAFVGYLKEKRFILLIN